MTAESPDTDATFDDDLYFMRFKGFLLRHWHSGPLPQWLEDAAHRYGLTGDYRKNG